MSLFDLCFNFTSSKFRADEQAVLARALAAGVDHFLVTGSDQEDSRFAVNLAERYQNGMYASVGVHPHLAHNWQDDTLDALRQLAKSDRVKAIGEAGLDYHRNLSTHQQQHHALRQQIELAIELERPLFLHERDAHEDFYTILRDYQDDLSRAVVHCFTGQRAALERYIEMDLYIGITGWICDERRGKHLHDLVGLIPQERLMIETDAPYLIPRSYQPKPKNNRNEPSLLPHIAKYIAHHRGEDEQHLCQFTMQNTLRFLDIPLNP